MTAETDWHADERLLGEYLAGRLSTAGAASVEAHVGACARCRGLVAVALDPPATARLARTWSAVEACVDGHRNPRAERTLRRLGLSDGRAALVTRTAVLHWPVLLLAATALAVLTLLVLTEAPNGGDVYVFVVGAPLVPLAAVAAAFGARDDPVAEILTVTPLPAFELLLVRATAVLATTTALTALASLALPHRWGSVAWLLPALGLSLAALAAATWVPASYAALALSGAWVAAATLSWRRNRFEPDVLHRFVALRPAGQLAFAALALAGAVVLTARRHALDLRRFP